LANRLFPFLSRERLGLAGEPPRWFQRVHPTPVAIFHNVGGRLVAYMSVAMLNAMQVRRVRHIGWQDTGAGEFCLFRGGV